ncbi:MAG: hypothetical protein CBC48_08190 [bacterium TMED88]|nr:hypothetical protein [Deltaproteobacteria bacterium]OUV32570.1 MAG: hypothetical protein CBC48_08190 [bacterium TMED88]
MVSKPALLDLETSYSLGVEVSTPASYSVAETGLVSAGSIEIKAKQTRPRYDPRDLLALGPI